MTYSSLHKPLAVLLVAGAFAACHKSAPMAGPTPAGAARANAVAAKPAAVTAAAIAQGDSIYHARACAGCHGPQATGGQGGPDLTTSTHLHVNGSYDDFVRIITTGVPKDSIKVPTHRFAMQPRGTNRNAPPLSDDQIHAVAAYVYSLSHK